MSSSDWYIRCLKIFGGESRYSFNTNVSEYVDGVFARYDLDDSGKISFEGNDQTFYNLIINYYLDYQDHKRQLQSLFKWMQFF